MHDMIVVMYTVLLSKVNPRTSTSIRCVEKSEAKLFDRFHYIFTSETFHRGTAFVSSFVLATGSSPFGLSISFIQKRNLFIHL